MTKVLIFWLCVYLSVTHNVVLSAQTKQTKAAKMATKEMYVVW